jgi:hypothetical protein
MLLINLTTIYQCRTPTLTHTQHHAEKLSRSHLKCVINGELDTYVTNLINNLIIPAQSVPRTHHTRRKKHTQPSLNTKTSHGPPSPTTITRKRPHTLTHTQLHCQPPPLALIQNPPKKPDNAMSAPHTPTCPQTDQHPIVPAITYNPPLQPALHTQKRNPATS